MSGVTAIVAQPDTEPASIDAQTVRSIRDLGRGQSHVDFGVTGITLPGRSGAIGELKREGAVSVELLMADAPTIFSDEDESGKR